jgi:5'-nucleotidase
MMYISRRTFIKTAGLAGATAITGITLPLRGMSARSKRITLLHTNDTHSRIDPYPDNDPNYPGMGGYAGRSALINYYRSVDPELILLDAGDIFQGTPYYNMYGGEPELRLMSMMGYDAATIGNHEFDNGLDGLLKVLPYAGFPFVTANLDFSNTILHGKTQAYLILRRNGVKVGIYGLGIDPKGLVSPLLYQDTRYLDPIDVAREIETQLHAKYQCDLIVCLSHLGYSYRHDKVSDVKVAQNTSYTDIIIGGHTHTLLDPPARVSNLKQRDVTIAQTGSGGVRLGMITVEFYDDEEEKNVATYTTKIFKKQAV